jgi:outer membrane protein OmpA-like peptidoglycan-associated protein
MTMKIRTSLCAVALGSLLLTGCASTGNPDTAKTRSGAAIGAGIGAVIGLLSKGDKFDNAAIGAAIGGLGGAAIGNYQDQQERKLRAQLANSGVEVQRVGNNITLDMPGGVTFATNSADINANFYSVLDQVAATLGEFNQTVIEVAGHTDSTGSRAYNMTLSERRAGSVVSYLSGRGIARERMIAVGAGPDHPVDTNETAEGRAQNRRVEITIVPVEKKTS